MRLSRCHGVQTGGLGSQPSVQGACLVVISRIDFLPRLCRPRVPTAPARGQAESTTDNKAGWRESEGGGCDGANGLGRGLPRFHGRPCRAGAKGTGGSRAATIMPCLDVRDQPRQAPAAVSPPPELPGTETAFFPTGGCGARLSHRSGRLEEQKGQISGLPRDIYSVARMDLRSAPSMTLARFTTQKRGEEVTGQPRERRSALTTNLSSASPPQSVGWNTQRREETKLAPRTCHEASPICSVLSLCPTSVLSDTKKEPDGCSSSARAQVSRHGRRDNIARRARASPLSEGSARRY